MSRPNHSWVPPFEIESGQVAVELEMPDERAADTGDLPAVPMAEPRRPWWRRLGLIAGIGVLGLLLIQAIDYVRNLIATAPLLGWPFAVLLVVVVVSVVGAFGREFLDIRRMRRAARLREEGLRLARSELTGGARGYLGELDRQLGQRLPADVEAADARGLGDAEVLALYERQVLGPRDKRAYRLVLEASRDVGILTALSPLGLLDGFLVLWRTLVMMRGIARVYGIALGPAASLGLLKRCIRNAAIAGVADMVGHAAVEHLGASLTALLSARAGQGAGNALLAGRLGLEAIRLTRPLPFLAEPAPRLAHVRAAIFEGGKPVA